jgi:hypothetical protein
VLIGSGDDAAVSRDGYPKLNHRQKVASIEDEFSVTTDCGKRPRQTVNDEVSLTVATSQTSRGT